MTHPWRKQAAAGVAAARAKNMRDRKLPRSTDEKDVVHDPNTDPETVERSE